MIRSLILLLALQVTVSALAQDAGYALLIAQTDALTREGKYLEALAKAQEAIVADNNRFEGFYYAAYALYKRDLADDAVPLAEQAVAKAPAERRAEAQKLVEAIRGTIAIRKDLADAKSAVADGLWGRAAEAYTSAWKNAPTRDDLGLEAARLFIRVNDLPAASRILYALKNHPNDGQVAAEVDKSLQQIESALNRAYEQRWRSAQEYGRKPGEQENYLKALEDCVALAPHRAEAAVELAAYFAVNNNFQSVEKCLLEANRSGALRSQNILQDARFVPSFGNERFVNLMRDLFGGNVADEVAGVGRDYANVRAKIQAANPGDRLRLLIQFQREKPLFVGPMEIYDQADVVRKFLEPQFQALVNQVNAMGTLKQGNGKLKGKDSRQYLTEGFQVTYRAAWPSCDGWTLHQTSLGVGMGERYWDIKVDFSYGSFQPRLADDRQTLYVDRISLPAWATQHATLLASRLNSVGQACQAIQSFEAYMRSRTR